MPVPLWKAVCPHYSHPTCCRMCRRRLIWDFFPRLWVQVQQWSFSLTSSLLFPLLYFVEWHCGQDVCDWIQPNRGCMICDQDYFSVWSITSRWIPDTNQLIRYPSTEFHLMLFLTNHFHQWRRALGFILWSDSPGCMEVSLCTLQVTWLPWLPSSEFMNSCFSFPP